VTNPIPDPLVGRTVAQYEVLARLGGGGMGVVYKARDTRLGRTVALKFLPPQWSHDEDAKQRFVREAQAASATEHRNICTIHDIVTSDDGQLFIVMAYYEGVTLKQRLEGGPLPVDEALDIATQIADGLARAHAQGVVHRDVKPGNIILAEDGVRILDFGLATFVDALQLTVAGSTLGTAPYMSPEQVKGETADASTDVWAAGVILYQMLTGHVPFRGSHHEAIAYAIRHETPASIRQARPDVAEEIEQIVFRALHKEKSIRYASGRELARALRQVRGQTVPLDLRTQEVIAPAAATLPARRRRSRTPIWAAAAAILVAILAGAAWMMRPPIRPTVVILPISNQTGRAELAPYQRALTLAMIDALSASPVVRPVPWPRALQMLRRFDDELASVAAEGALAGVQGTQTLVRPTLTYEDQQWRIRIEIRDGASATTLHRYESPAMVSALVKETAYALMFDGARLVEDHFGRRNPRRWFGRAPVRELASLDAMKAFEEGINLYDEQEYAPAHAAFAAAGKLDPASAVAEVWRGRAALSMRDRAAASVAATSVERLLTTDAPMVTRLVAQAMVAEARGDDAGAALRWRNVIDAAPDEPAWRLELAMLEERRADTRDAWAAVVARYREALAADPASIRPHLELCRLYNLLQEGPNALKSGQTAVDAYRKAGWPGGEAQALLCLVDALRSGSGAERDRAGELANQAHAILVRLGFSYNLPRAVYYQGLAVAEQGSLDRAVALWGSALAAAEQSGNRPLQPIVLTNLGVANNGLGKPALAAEQFSRSAALYEAMGEERRSARQLYNNAALRVNYSVNDDALLRDIDNALAVSRKQGDNDFEIAELVTRAQFFRNVGRFEESEREASRALELSRRHGLEQRRAGAVMEQARLQVQRSQYAEALATLASIQNASARVSIGAGIVRGRALTRLGDFAGARQHLEAARAALDSQEDTGLRPMLHSALGELAYQQGRLTEARGQFERVAVQWDNELNEEAVVESVGYLGLLDVVQGKARDGIARLTASVDHARKTRRGPLEVRLRVLLAAAHMAANQPREAARSIEQLPEAWQRLGGDWRAQVHYWRGRAAADAGQSQVDYDVARSLLREFTAAMPERFRISVTDRADLRPI
jgi:tetratricopeptide (TPR) repeat protein